MTTQMHRIVCVLLVAVMAGLVLAGWFLVAQPQLASASDSAAQLEAQQAQIATSQSNLQHLRDQKGRLSELSSELASLQTSIPADLASSPLVAGIDQEAAAAGVLITDISVDDPKTYAPTPTAGSGPAASRSSATPAPTPSATPSASPSATAAPGPAQSGKKSFVPPTDSRITAANFIPIPVTITVKGDWEQTLAFVKNLQSGPRLYAVGTMGVKTSPDDASSYTTIVSGYVFAILDPASLAAETAKKNADAAAKKAAAKPTPSATPTQKPAPTASTTPVPSGSPTPSATPSR